MTTGMTQCVVAFTDLYHPTVNGITDTVALWKARWSRRGGRMPVVYPAASDYVARADEYPIRSVPAPLYTEYRLGIPLLPRRVPDPEVVHVHTPFTIGITGLEVGRLQDVPVVGSYHTLMSQRVRYFVASDDIAAGLRRLVRQYERWFFDAVDLVITPSATARSHLIDRVGVSTTVEVVSNGIDTSFFRPVESVAFERAHDLISADEIVGYAGRHSPEKNLLDLVNAVDGTDLTLLLAGDGPARPLLEERARSIDADVRFLGFLDREVLPAFYSVLDVFGFPSPTETQGLVALQANACGTPVVGADAGALKETVIEGETGFLYPPGDIEAFRDGLFRALDERSQLRDRCLGRREWMSVERSIDRLSILYDRVHGDD